MLVQQYLSTSPRPHHDILSAGGALKRGQRMGSLADDDVNDGDHPEGLKRTASTPVRFLSSLSCHAGYCKAFACRFYVFTNACLQCREALPILRGLLCWFICLQRKSI